MYQICVSRTNDSWENVALPAQPTENILDATDDRRRNPKPIF